MTRFISLSPYPLDTNRSAPKVRKSPKTGQPRPLKKQRAKSQKDAHRMGTPRAAPGHPAGRPRRRQRSAFKARGALEALEALTGQKTLNALASAFGVHPVQIAQWKRPLLDARAGVFASGAPGRREREHEPLGEHRYQEIGPVLASGRWRWTGCEKRASPACPTGPTTGVDRADASAVAQRAAGRPAGQRARGATCWAARARGDLLGSARAGTTSR